MSHKCKNKNSKTILKNNDSMEEMTLKDFWKSLDTKGKDSFRMAVVNATYVSPNTVDKYATGNRRPSVKRKEIIIEIAQNDFGVTLIFD